MTSREDMLEDLQPTLEKREIHLTAYQLDHLMDWVDVQIEFACRQQREICANKYKEIENDINDNPHVNKMIDKILNCPSPLDEVK